MHLLTKSGHNLNICHLNIDYYLSDFACDAIIYMKWYVNLNYKYTIKTAKSKKKRSHLQISCSRAVWIAGWLIWRYSHLWTRNEWERKTNIWIWSSICVQCDVNFQKINRKLAIAQERRRGGTKRWTRFKWIREIENE